MEVWMILLFSGSILILVFGLLAASFIKTIQPQQMLIVSTPNERVPRHYLAGRKFLLPFYHRYTFISLEKMNLPLHARTKTDTGRTVNSHFSICVFFPNDQAFTPDILLRLMDIQAHRFESVVRQIFMAAIHQAIHSPAYAKKNLRVWEIIEYTTSITRDELQDLGLRVIHSQIHTPPQTNKLTQFASVSELHERFTENQLRPITLKFDFQDIPSEQGIPLCISLSVVVAIETKDPDASKIAEKNLSRYSIIEFEEIIKSVISQRFKSFISTIPFEKINQDGEWFLIHCSDTWKIGLSALGLCLVNVTIHDITDKFGYNDARSGRIEFGESLDRSK